MTPAPLTRRSFVASSGAFGLALSFGLRGAADAGQVLRPFRTDAWITISADGVITIQAPSSEMGQGVLTSLPVIVAEELDADWKFVRIQQSPPIAKIYGNPALGGSLSTLGSRSVTGYYDTLRLVGAQARALLLANAARILNVPVTELSTGPSVVLHAPSNRQLTYGTIAANAIVPTAMPTVSKEDLKPLRRFRLIGTDVPRVDIPGKINGGAKYGIDTLLDGMIYGALVRTPVTGEKPVEVDDAQARLIPGFIKTMVAKDAVGVICETREATVAAKAKLKVTWTTQSIARTYDSDAVAAEYGVIASDVAGFPGVQMVNTGDARSSLSNAASVFSATFFSDHLAHMSMEPLNATARFRDGALEVWASTQSPSTVFDQCAAALGLMPENITLHPTLIGGAFGRTSDDADHAVYAGLLARAVPGRPVKLLMTREDDILTDKFQPTTAVRAEIGLDASGAITAWHQRIVCPSHFARSQPASFIRLQGKDGVTGGGGDFRYDISDHRVDYVRVERGVDVGPWRGTSARYAKYAIESCIDDIAAHNGIDPVEYRLRMLSKEPRAQRVINAVAQMANWGATSLPDRALGLSYSDALNAYSSAVAEVSVNRETGQISVHRVWLAMDGGIAVQPRNMEAQLEGAIVMALGGALYERVSMKNGELEQHNFGQYRVMRMADVPEITISIISTDNHPTGAGEAAISSTAPAVGNAFTRLTGKRLRHLPMTPERVLAALKV